VIVADAIDSSRAVLPVDSGFADVDGVRIAYEVFGQGDQTLLLFPPWSIIHSRHWKAQVPYLSRHFRVVAFDGRGNGRSDRPTQPEAYAEREFAADALAVLDATQTPRAVVVGFSMGAQRGLLLAADHPERVEAAVFIGGNYPGGGQPVAERTVYSWEEELDTEEGWAKHNRHYWLRDYQGYLEFFMSRMFTEPHSTKPIEDGVGWGLDTTPETLALTYWAPFMEPEEARELAGRVRCPVLVIHGEEDAHTSVTRGIALAEDTGGRLVLLEGSFHAPQVRDPVRVNLLLRDFITPAPPPRRWVRGRSRRRRALYLSSPIGLGHAQRDVAIAAELRKLHPDLEIDWLAQHPVTRVLEAAGERIHPASALLANESAHIERESAEHDLHCFQAIRRMDEILLANFMVFHDLVRDQPYDLWIGDEAWELDYYLHENPEQKRAAYAWLTDFVGWLPMPDGGEREALVAADYNAEMITHIARYPRLRDQAVFVGNPDDIVPDAFGPGLPVIGDWTREHYAFAGYVTGFDPADLADRQALRQELGYRDDEQVCIVTVGGSGVGGHLLRRVIQAFPEAKRQLPGLRMVVVAGPRIDPDSLPSHDGLEVRAFVPQLYRHLAACDLAVVQGGLTTCMELTANRRPFLYFPLAHHFEQTFHVAHRLDRYRAGRRMDYASSDPDAITAAITAAIGRPVDYRPVETDGAARAANLIADLI
jgi:pimeloyl-ACP methyl ester carboxylesterase/predicted glycosyltransferase